MVVAPVTEKTSDSSQHHLRRIAELTRQILEQVMLSNKLSMAHNQNLNVSKGVDFYQEVERFEVQLIRFMLQRAGGNQRKAAKFLTLKPSTLNAKIKQYRINASLLEPFASDL